MLALYLKALHIIFVVTWFAGLFYMVRLFIYHVEAEKKEENERNILQTQYKLMEKRLWYIITWPSMILVMITGVWLALPYFDSLGSYSWLILKIVLVLGLTLYHLQCGIIFKQLQNDLIKLTSFKLRLWNEVATLFLFSIVFVIVLKDALDWIWGVIGLVLLAVLFMLAAKLYRANRKKRASKQGQATGSSDKEVGD